MMNMRIALTLCFLPNALFAQSQGLVDAQVIVGGQTADGRPLAALVVTLEPGWKTYWRSPGEGGLPPEFDWSRSQNLGAVEVLWPRPHVFSLNGMENLGYADQMVLPFAITPSDPAQPVQVVADMTLGICKDICVPIALTLGGAVPAGLPPLPMIEAAMAALPMTAAQAGISACTYSARPIKDGVQVDMALTMPAWTPAAPEVVAVEHRNNHIWASPPQISRAGDTLTAVFDLVPPEAKPFALSGQDLRMSIVAGAQAAEIWGCTQRP